MVAKKKKKVTKKPIKKAVPKKKVVRKKPSKKTKKTKKTKKAKVTKNPVKKGMKRRGRPPGSKNKKASTESDEYIPPKSYKFLGYCPKRGCEAMIGTLDLIKKTIFVCPKCSKRDRITKLKKEMNSMRDKPKTKKEYLQTTSAGTY